jgi:predicted peptidase
MKTILAFLGRTVSQKGASILFVVGLLAGGSGTAYAVSEDDFVYRWFTNAQGVLPYRLFIPTNYTATERFPLVLFLHGAGGNGDDNRTQLLDQPGPLVFASEANELEHPSFMVAPQAPLGTSWTVSSVRVRVLGIINALESEFNVDSNRLYITGLSMGGYGTWDYIGR